MQMLDEFSIISPYVKLLKKYRNLFNQFVYKYRPVNINNKNPDFFIVVDSDKLLIVKYFLIPWNLISC